jgi:hypothetical protein
VRGIQVAAALPNVVRGKRTSSQRKNNGNVAQCTFVSHDMGLAERGL